MPDWAASLIVGGIVLLVGTILAGVARKALSPSGMIPTVQGAMSKRMRGSSRRARHE
jgi:hypothetical protein